MDGENHYFQNALRDFTAEAAYAGAVRHLADLGYSPSKIVRNLTYPATLSQVTAVIWRHFTQQGILRLEDPAIQKAPEQATYVKETGEYGRVSYRRVVTSTSPMDAVTGAQGPDACTVTRDCGAGEYIRVEFGRERYQHPVEFASRIGAFEEETRDWIENLPWPLTPVWVLKESPLGQLLQKETER